MYQRKNNPFIQLSSGYPLFLGQKRHAVSFKSSISSMLSEITCVNFTFKLLSFYISFWRAKLSGSFVKNDELNWLDTRCFVVLSN